MASITKRGNSWVACWKQGGLTVKRSTGIKVKEPGISARQAEKLARETAQMMEAAARGETTCAKAMAAVRAAAVAMGAAQKLPTVREFLAAVPADAGEKAEANRRRAFRRFLEFLGVAAEAPVDSVSVELCEAFIREALREVSRGTAEGHRVYLSAAWNRGVNVLGILERNPWKAVSTGKLARACVDGGAVQRRLPFTLAEIRRLMQELPEPWRDMVAVSWFAFGLRLSDVCLLRWDAWNREEGYIYIREKKTRKERFLPVVEALRVRLERLAEARREGEVYVFPLMAHYYNAGCPGYVSTQFTALLRAMGIIQEQAVGRGGRRHAFSAKSFHSIRHSVVSCLRADGAFTADVVRDAVGHESELVERGYFTASGEQRRAVGEALQKAVDVTPAGGAAPGAPLPVPAPEVAISA